MTGGMTLEADSSGWGAADEVMSPELALVDPEAARRARHALPEIVLTESRIGVRRETVGAVPRFELAFDGPAREVDIYEGAPFPQPEAEERPFNNAEIEALPTLRRRRGIALVGLVGAAAALLLITPRVLDERNASLSAVTQRASAKGVSAIPTVRSQGGRATSSNGGEARTTPRVSSGVLGTVVTISPRGVTSPTKTNHAAKSSGLTVARSAPGESTRNFGWVPVKHAFGYRIEFRSGPRLVLQARAQAARLRVSRGQLRPGRYRWLVWRVNRHGAPVGTALVDAVLTIR